MTTKRPLTLGWAAALRARWHGIKSDAESRARSLLSIAAAAAASELTRAARQVDDFGADAFLYSA